MAVRRRRTSPDSLYSTEADERPLPPEGTESDAPATVGTVDTLAATDFKAIADEFTAEITAQLQQRQPTEQDWSKWQRVYLAKRENEVKNYPFLGGSNIVVPIAGEYVEQMHARIMQSVFTAEPLWVVQQRNRKFQQFAKPLERYLDAIRQDVFDEFAVCENAVMETIKLGTSGIYNDWIDSTSYRYDERLGMTVPAGRTIGPAPRWQALEDILVPQGYPDHQSAPWMALRSWYSFARLRELEYAGVLIDVDALQGHEDDETNLRMARRAGAGGKTTSQPVLTSGTDIGTRNFGLYSPWTVFFRRDLDQDGYPEEYVMMLHLTTQTLMRFKPNPYPSSMRPLCVLRFVQIEGEFYGIGIPQMVEHAQAEASAIHNERRDNAHLANIRMYKARMTSNIGDTIRPESGKVIKLVDPTDLQEFKVSDNRQVDIYEEGVVTDQAGRRIGVNDLAQGRMTSPLGRASATTVMALMQEGAQRFDMNITKIRRGLTEQGMQIIELYQTHGVPGPEEPGSPESFLDDEEAMLVRQLLETPDNLRGMVKVKLNAATSAVNREVERQNNMQLVNFVMSYIAQVTTVGMQISSPMVAPELKIAMVRSLKGLDDTVRFLIQSYNRFDLESMLSADLVQQLAVASIQTQMLMAQGGDPSAVMGGGGPTGTEPSQVSTQQPTGAPGSGPQTSPYEATPGMNGGGMPQ